MSRIGPGPVPSPKMPEAEFCRKDVDTYGKKKAAPGACAEDWAEVNDALRSIHEYEHALTEMGVDMSRRIDAVKAEYTKSAEPLQKRVKQLERTFRSM